MGENLYCPGNKVLRNFDSYYRTFRGIPEMNDSVKKMLLDYAEQDKPESILLFFYETCGFDMDYSGFLMREVIGGNV